MNIPIGNIKAAVQCLQNAIIAVAQERAVINGSINIFWGIGHRDWKIRC